MPRPVGVDLFAGAGGLTLGFEQAGFDVVAAVEFDPVHAATHEFNFPECAVICRDVASVSGDDILASSPETEAVDVVFGGAPCQGFSLIGKRALDDPRNRLVKHFIRLVAELKPKYFLFENVKGLTVGEHAEFLDEIVQDFGDIGYLVNHPRLVLNAADFGVPQNRERLFLVGRREDQPAPRVPAPTTPRLEAGESEGPTVWDALSDIPEVENRPELFTRDWCVAKFGPASEYAAPLRNQVLDRGNLARPRSGHDPRVLTSSLLTRHTADSRRRFRKTPHGETEPVSRFFKLDPNGLCNTLRAGTASDRGAFTSPRPIHPFSPRCITNREAARLHSYPDWFRFHRTKWHGFRQIGNSVPPLLARAVAAELRRGLGAVVRPLRRPVALGDQDLLSLNPSEAAARYSVPPDVVGRRLRIAAG